MDNYLKFQIAAALVRDGAYKGGFDELTAALGDVYLGKRYRFGGAATPGLSPGSVNTPTLYATARVGVYAGFSNHSVDAGQVCIFISDDGAEWTKYIIIASGSGEPDYPQDPALFEYFTIEAKEPAIVKFYRSSYGESYGDFKVEASTDGGQTWTEITATPEGAEVADLSPGDKVLLRGTNERYGYYDDDDDGINLANFNADGQCYVYGNIMSLMDGDDFSRMREVKDGGFAFFFNDFDVERSGAWVLSKEGHPLLLPATTLAQDCYASMFNGCTSLEAAPALPATTLAQGCYASMFHGCANLAFINAMFTTTPEKTYTHNWVKGVKATGTFVKSASATWNVSGDNGVPTGWTVETA